MNWARVTDEGRLWRGVVEFEDVGNGWSAPWRLPVGSIPEGIAGHLGERARDPAGVRLDVVTAGVLEFFVHGRPEAPVDVVVDGILVDRVNVDGEQRIKVEALADRPVRVEVWLPQFGSVAVSGLASTGALSAAPDELRWVTYGSSITQCRGARGPSETWPSLVARRNRWDVTALGFGGECHLDPVVADTIASLPADLLSLCLGVNIHQHATFSARTLVPAAVDFIKRARASRTIPSLVIGPIAAPDIEDEKNAVGLTLADVRGLVRRSADLAGATYLDGRELLGIADQEFLTDERHPGPRGYELMAKRILPHLSSALGHVNSEPDLVEIDRL